MEPRTRREFARRAGAPRPTGARASIGTARTTGDLGYGRAMRRLLPVLTLLATVTFAADASAATRYAAPAGSGPEPCASAAPCSLADATTGAGVADGDTVEVAVGEYTVPGYLDIGHRITLQGASSTPPYPVLTGNHDGALVFMHDFGSTVRRLAIQNLSAGASAGALAGIGDGVYENLVLRGTGKPSAAAPVGVAILSPR